MHERLKSFFIPHLAGGRLLVACGAAETDIFDLNPPEEPRDLTESLLWLAVQDPSRFDVALSFDATCKMGFARNVEGLWKKLTGGETAPSGNIQNAQTFTPKSPSARPATPSQEVTPEAVSGFRNLLGKLERVWRNDKRVFAVIKHPEELWLGEPTKQDLEYLRELGRIAQLEPGNPDSRLVVVVKPSYRERFTRMIDDVTNLSGLRTEIEVPLPDANELAAFIGRRALECHLYGDARGVADIASQRGMLLRAIAAGIARLKELPQQERCVDRLLDSGDQESPETVSDALEKMVGLKEVKDKFRTFKALAKQQSENRLKGVSAAGMTTHMLFMGPPGTGKTVVAELMSRYLRALGLRRNGALVKISAADVHSAYNPGDVVTKMKEAIDRATGGVLFVDEAYQFAEDRWLRQALEALLGAMEERRDTLTVIFAGYEDRMLELFNVNAGFKSRFPRDNWFYFKDYSVDELVEIACRMMKSSGLEVSQPAKKKIRLWIEAEKKRGRVNNARGARHLIDMILQRRACAAGQGNVSFELEWIPEPVRPDKAEADKICYELKSRLSGCESLFKTLEGIESEALYADETAMDPPRPPCLQFVGPAGTGKTTAAREMGRMLKALAVLSRGHTHEVSPLGDLVGTSTSAIGERLDRAFEQARGGVLFIDEAYQLTSAAGGQDIINQITQRLTAPTFSDTAVIVAGYVGHMRELMRMNPGLASRFPQVVEFACPSEDQLVRIVIEREFGRYRLTIPSGSRPAVCDAITNKIRQAKNMPGFAGVRSACLIADEIRKRQNSRVMRTKENDRFFVLLEDVNPPADNAATMEEAIREFQNQFVGLERIRDELVRMAALVKWRSKRGDSSGAAPRLIFAGPPGTGKTSVARHIGRLLHAMGVLARSEVIEETGAGIQSGYVGQTPERVRSLFRSARGGVLFIDEIYGLADSGMGGTGEFKREAVNELVAQLTAPENNGTCVVVAGYADRMDEFFAQNPGVRSRFQNQLSFPALTAANAALLAWAQVKTRFRLSDTRLEEMKRAAGSELENTLKKLAESPSYGSARSVGGFVDKIEEETAYRCFLNAGAEEELAAADIQRACQSIVCGEGA